jgi:hypothetical protein
MQARVAAVEAENKRLNLLVEHLLAMRSEDGKQRVEKGKLARKMIDEMQARIIAVEKAHVEESESSSRGHTFCIDEFNRITEEYVAVRNMAAVNFEDIRWLNANMQAMQRGVPSTGALEPASPESHSDRSSTTSMP